MNKTITQMSLRRAAALLTLMLLTILTVPTEAKAEEINVEIYTEPDVSGPNSSGGACVISGTKVTVTPNTGYYAKKVEFHYTWHGIESGGELQPQQGTGDQNGLSAYYTASLPTGATNGRLIVTFGVCSDNVLVSFDLNGHPGASNPPQNQNTTIGLKVTRPTTAPTDGDDVVIGWCKDAAGTTPFDFDTPLDKNMPYDGEQGCYNLTLYAKWSLGPMYLTFYANDGSESMSVYTQSGGSIYTIPECMYAINRYAFIGWATSADGDVTYQPGQKIMLTSDLTFYAVWEKTNIKGQGSAQSPFQISSIGDLIYLANQVNGGNNFGGKYIQLMNDISFVSTTDWNDATSTENNFPAIGNYYSEFCGVFDGDGYTISGIRIYKGGNDWTEDMNVGLFGHIGSGGTVKNLTLANARITGYNNVGGIVGCNQGGTIDNCHVLSNVAIHSENTNSNYHGGIAGRNDGDGTSVSHCTSAVTLSIGSEAGGSAYGGIVGGGPGTLHDNLAIGVTIPAGIERGAIQGNGTGTLQHNYYSNCTVGGTTSGIGSYGTDVTDNDGAVSAVILSETEAVPAMNQNDKVVFRRTFTQDVASTVCLPFAIDKKQAAAAGKFYTFAGVDTSGDEWEVVMQEAAPSNLVSDGLAANTPYLFKPAATGPVLFYGTAPATVSAGETSDTEGWTFTGTYAEKRWDATHNTDEIGSIYGFATGQGYEGTAASTAAGVFIRLTTGGIKPFRAYLKYTGSLARTRGEGGLPETMTVRLVNANGEIQGIGEIRLSTGEVTFDSRAWYDLNGRRLDGKPSEKGIYINGGRKVVIK